MISVMILLQRYFRIHGDFPTNHLLKDIKSDFKEHEVDEIIRSLDNLNSRVCKFFEKLANKSLDELDRGYDESESDLEGIDDEDDDDE